MTPEILGRIREIYEKAIVLGGAAREALLDRECDGDAGIREEVESLLEARQRIPEWLNRPALGAAGVVVPKMEGRHVGGYTLIREIGRGGMGCVYLAERSDGAFRKQVAIKLVLPSPHTTAVIARFQQERQILASLDHPNIARLLDGGVTEEGWPYFVMEFVDGQPINQWCDERALNVSRRIELFRGVIAAVQYAHQRLVVHRDLKPGNIYVSKDGAVKLLDFGIAKVLSAPELGCAPDTVTMTAMMTPEYASPEQVNGAAITTLSDVYSLGVILYELLTGHRPYRLLSAAMHEMARVIAEVEPVRPSQVVTATMPDLASAVREGDPNRQRKRLLGDLDSILLMSLQKEPERRYGSVEAFAGDLEKHLEHRPVAAREPTPWYRLMRFGRRNVGGVAAGLMVAISLLAGLAAVVWQTRRELTPTRLTAVDAGPFVLFAFGVVVVGLGFAAYLARPSRRALVGAFAGGAIWAGSAIGNAWLGHTLGWWRSQVAEIPEPLVVFGEPIWRSPYVWIASCLGLAALMFLAAWIQRRYGWTWAAILMSVLSVYQVTRERIWFSVILPAIDLEPGWGPYLTETAIFAAGGFAGLLAMRVITGEKRSRT